MFLVRIRIKFVSSKAYRREYFPEYSGEGIGLILFRERFGQYNGVVGTSSAVPVIPAIVGPTASGKSAFAREIAERTGGRLISVDSRKIYRRLDIGTAKPTADLIARYDYAMINLIEPPERYSAHKYAQAATAVIEETLAAQRLPILVGGTGLYLRALKDGLFEGPGTDELVRAAIRREAEAIGWEKMYEILLEIDPEAAAKTSPRNHARIERALEVYRLTGEPITKRQRDGQYRRPPWRFEMFGIDRPRDEVCRRIDARTDRMVQDGLFEEVECLLAAGVDPDAPGMRTLGYVEAVAGLSGQITRSQAIAGIKLNTRRYAKRQLTWFLHQEAVQWLLASEVSVETVLFRLL